MKRAASLLLAIAALSFQANAADLFNLRATVKDKATDGDLTEGRVSLYDAADSTLVKEMDAFQKIYSGSSSNWTVTLRPQFKIDNLDRSKRYVLQLTHDMYEPLTVDVDPSKLSPKLTEMNLGTLYMTKAKVLKEVTVTATKVKFYHKGDTIVYNADAFVLAEGSMLDALIAQLPGVELKDNGQIFVNGRFVENLMLNGKDFFKGNNKILLENLGAYTVKNIAVYDGQNEMDRIMGKEYGKKELTMDVQLKKEYMRGFLLNAEGGYGTSDRFGGQLFGLVYGDNSRVGFFGNANNLSNTWNPSQYSTGYTMPTPQSGDIKTYSGGFDYNSKIAHSPISFEGSGEANYQRKHDARSTYTTNFLSTGDTYGYSFSDDMLRQLSVKTSHQMKVIKENWNMQVNPKFEYVRNNNSNSLAQAEFTREWDDVDRTFIEAIYDNRTPDALQSLINRNLNDNRRHGHSIWANIWSNGKFKMPNGTDAITYLAAYTYKRMSFSDDERFLIDFGNNGGNRQFADRHFAGHPDFNWRAKGNIGYIWNAARGLYFDMTYTYQRFHSRSVSDLFAADNYNDATDGGLAAGLPSATASRLEFDPANSFDSRYREENHQVGIDVSWRNPNSPISVHLKFPFEIRRQWLHYMRGDINAAFGRDKAYLGDLSGDINITSKLLGWIYIGLTRKVTSPDMVDMVDFTNSLDPLNIRSGNKSLKDMASDNIRIYFNKTLNQKRQMQLGYGAEFTGIENALAYGYTYDRATGVKTGSMYNVSGNWNTHAYEEFSLQFGPQNHFSFSQRTAFDHARSADLIGTDQQVPVKNIVVNNSLSERLRLGYVFSKNRIELNFNGKRNRYTSRQQGFTDFSAWDYNYGIKGVFTLPASFGIQTDLNMYSRRGYSDSALNKDNLVWNARVTYSIDKLNMLIMADGYDLLHNLSYVFYTVNAQARTETYANTLPRYFMVHLQWKFHKLPKNKQK